MFAHIVFTRLLVAAVDTWQIKQQAKYAEWAQVCSHMQINALLTGFYTTGKRV